MKRLLAVFLAVWLTAFPLLAAAQGEIFPDVRGTVYEQAAGVLLASSIVQGYRDGTLRPWDFLTRAEALKISLKAAGEHEHALRWYQEHRPSLPLFYDVRQTEWYIPFLEVGFMQGVITGMPDGTFRPHIPIAASEAVALLLRAFGEHPQQGAFRTAEHFQNVPDQWFTPFISLALQRNIVMHANRLEAEIPLTRGQFLDMAYRLREVKARDWSAYSGPKPLGRLLVNLSPAQVSSEVVSSPSSRLPFTAEQRAKALQYASKKPFAVTIPTLKIRDLTVTHPADPFSDAGILEVLNDGVGHLFAYPGAGGKVMIYGHSSGYPWDVSEYTKVFRTVNKLKAGDDVYVTYAGRLFVYRVVRKQTIKATDRSPFLGGGEEAILYTCWPPDSVRSRYLVHAELLGVIDL